MHQQQWMAVVEELGGPKAFPIPNSHPQSEEHRQFSYVFLGTMKDGTPPPQGRWTQGPSLDGKAEFSAEAARPYGEEPKLAPARPGSGAQAEQIDGGAGGMADRAGSVAQQVVGAAREVADRVTGGPRH
jgi:Mn-containing catalase